MRWTAWHWPFNAVVLIGRRVERLRARSSLQPWGDDARRLQGLKQDCVATPDTDATVSPDAKPILRSKSLEACASLPGWIVVGRGWRRSGAGCDIPCTTRHNCKKRQHPLPQMRAKAQQGAAMRSKARLSLPLDPRIAPVRPQFVAYYKRNQIPLSTSTYFLLLSNTNR